MNIPKIAISNEDDPSMKIIEMRTPQMTTNPTTASPYKSIIKNRSSQPRTSSSTSTTTQSYYTAPTRQDSYLSNDPTGKSSVKNKSTEQLSSKPTIIDENDTENDVSDLSQIENASKIAVCVDDQETIPRRRGTISTSSILNSNENLPRRQYSLRQHRSSTSTNNATTSTSTSYNSARNYFIPHVSTPPPPSPYAEKGIRDSLSQINQEKRRNQSNPIRRTNSYRSSSSNTLRRFIVRDGKLIEQETNSSHPVIKRRSTLDYSCYPMTQIEASSIYETPKHSNIEQENLSKIDDSIRLMTSTSSSTDQRDTQTDTTKNNHPPTGVSFQWRFFSNDCVNLGFSCMYDSIMWQTFVSLFGKTSRLFSLSFFTIKSVCIKMISIKS